MRIFQSLVLAAALTIAMDHAAAAWRIVEGAPGKMQGTLVLRELTAVIDIPYTDSFGLICVNAQAALL